MNKTLLLTLIITMAGIGIPIMASLNASLGTKLQSPTLAAVILLGGGFIISIAAFALAPSPVMPSSPPQIQYYLGGIFIAFYVLAITAIAPRLGIGNAIFLVLLGQIISATFIDYFGLFDAEKINITVPRLLGISCMVIGVLLTKK